MYKVDKIIATAQGENGQLELTERRVRIKRKSGFYSAMVMGQSGDKELRISQISAIQLKEPSAWMKGFIQFTLIGGREERSAAWDVARDENSVIFSNKQTSEIKRFKNKVDELIDAHHQPQPANPSYIEELEKLASLRDSGIISEEEFEAKKKQLLGL